MNAKEAAAKASINKKHTEDTIKLKKEDLRAKDVALFYAHLHEKIETAVNAGKLTTKDAGLSIEFPADRFQDGIIQEVVTKLRGEGYSVSMDKHNAYNKLRFEISWV